MQADYAALREGSLFELVNLINWDNVHIHFKRASLRNVTGVPAALKTLASDWAADIRANQTARLLEGATPVAGFVRLGAAAQRLATDLASLPRNTAVRALMCIFLCFFASGTLLVSGVRLYARFLF